MLSQTMSFKTQSPVWTTNVEHVVHLLTYLLTFQHYKDITVVSSRESHKQQEKKLRQNYCHNFLQQIQSAIIMTIIALFSSYEEPCNTNFPGGCSVVSI